MIEEWNQIHGKNAVHHINHMFTYNDVAKWVIINVGVDSQYLNHYSLSMLDDMQKTAAF